MKNVVTIILIAFSAICLLNPKIRVARIIKGHFDSLRNDKTGKRSLWDLATFLVLPMGIAAYLCFFNGVVVDDSDINVLLTMFSIFAALLFNFLMLIIQVKEAPSASRKVNLEKYQKCISQTYYNVSFTTLLSVIAIILLWIISIWDSPGQLISCVVSWIAMTIIIMFFIALLMVLKRIFNIYSIDD